ncbi:amino acid permease [Francisella noatunensis]|uniref:Amino acid permease n=1 Tax=Francisella noatunensis TaxID=657445 RepID=A0A9Q2QJ46_9GAMM|nr:amino acid permease [Francisella noatunensis]MBK2028479.1 amino acid permease [Francisella noatunensis]MBK2034500.1 amino acid permease [Francisella noatunensis]MBK2049066.1 amino acid permease [Francisella noatunensis]MBK2050048.1 amino acid permease [Francisella noatunensis]MBK2051564.1 amino acid permease [Francisella noatunensis]
MSQKLKRGLHTRHMSMIALGGCIGTGLFVALGGAIADAGPGGTVLAYIIIAVMVYFLMASLGEMAAHSPVSGTFCEYATRYVDSALGFSTGWSYWFNWAITVATEVIAAAIIMQYWFPGSSILLWSAFFFVLVFALNIFSVKVYGEVECWLSFIKVSTVIIFIVVGFLSILGIVGNHGSVGFENWRIGDAPFHNGWWGFISVFMIAGFSFQGSELIGVTAGEAKDPDTSIPKAIKQTFWRLFIFYILAVVIISFLIPYNNPSLIQPSAGDDISVSPFTIVFESVGLSSAATIMNVIILTAIISACNASMYSATRVLWHLGRVKQAPQFFATTNSKGTPMIALLITALIGSSFFFVSFVGSGQIFIWLVNVSSLAGFIAWFTIALSHYRFRRAYIKQGKSLNDLPFVAKFFPWAPIIALILVSVVIVGQGVTMLTMEGRSWSSVIIEFLSTYVGFFAFVILYFAYKFIKKTKLIKLEDCDLSRES